MEKRLEQKGIITHFDENAFDLKLRTDQNKFEGGLNVRKSLDYLMNAGIEGYKIKSYSSMRPFNTKLIREMLFYNPLLALIQTYSDAKRVENGSYKIGQVKKVTHLLCVFGFDHGNFLMLDSSFPDVMYKMKEIDFSVIVKRVYDLTI